MYHAANAMSPEEIYRAARMAFLEMLLSGITAVGEFHYVHQDLEVARAILRAGEELGLRRYVVADGLCAGGVEEGSGSGAGAVSDAGCGSVYRRYG